MIKLCFRAMPVACLLLTGMFLTSVASAHVIKHHHPEPQYHQPQPTIIQLMIKALHAPAPQPEPYKHVQPPSYQPKPAPVSVMKVHADMCVRGTSWLNARSGPSTNHRVVAELAEGQRIHITTCQPSSSGNIYWCKTELGYGKTAYVSKKYLAACELSYRNHKW
ncbi:MAG: SH3 domain-containing protein [Alphaproteobacteria bacterium]